MSGQEHVSRGRARPAAIAAAGAILGFVFLATRQISDPGFFPDELFQAIPALNFLNPAISDGIVPATGPDVAIGGHELALMTSSYSGQVKTLAFIPVAELFGITAQSVRYFAVAVAALALLATYAFARRLFRSEVIALIAIVLLAVDPGMVFYARADQGQTVFMMLAKAVAIWQLLRWWDTRSTWSLVLGTFALGVGLYDKFIFIWVIWALALATAVVAGRAVWRRLTLRTVLVGAGAFIAGCLPLILYEFRSDIGTLGGYGDITDPDGTSGGVHFDERVKPLGGLPAQFAQRLRVLGDLLDGSTVSRLIDSPIPRHTEVVPVLVALAAVAICVQVLVRRPPTRELRAGAFAVLVTLIVLVSTAATEPGFHGHHVILAYPFPHLALALVVVQAGRLLARQVPPARRRTALATFVVVLTAVPLIVSASTTAGMIDSFSRSSGRGSWSDEIYEVVPYATRNHAGRPIVAVDWGIGYLLVGLSQGKLHASEMAYDLNVSSSAPVRRRLAARLRDRRTWFVLRAARNTTYRRARRRFFGLARELGYRPTLVRRFSDPRAGPQFEIYSMKRRPG